MFVHILPVTAPIGVAFFRAAVTETLEQRKLKEEAELFGLRRDIDYVSRLLFHSALFGFEHRFGMWGGGALKSSDIDEIAGRLAEGAIDDLRSQEVADQLLLRFGLFPKRIPRIKVLRLELCGGELYRKASRAQSSLARQDLESMAGNFIPWTDVLQDMQRRERLIIH